ncbi:MAG: NF038129 family PEP-CTERM protein [Methylococcales bacterium]|nr:NF038129 family PEP-CTERM protein [Methylococcales bacterium]
MSLGHIKRLSIACALLANATAYASNSLDVTVDTHSLDHTDGYLYFQYIPVNAADSSVTLSSFSSDATLGQQDTVDIVNGGAVGGALPGNVVFSNTNGVNDYNQAIQFGDTLNFIVSFSDPATGGLTGGGSTFSLGFFADALGNSPLMTTDGGVFSVSLLNDNSLITSIATSQTQVNAVPLPSALWLLTSGLIGLAGIISRKQNSTVLKPA